MQINNIVSLPVQVRGSDPQAAPSVRDGHDKANFDQTQALNQALNDSADVRPAEIARAKQLVSSLRYPPDEMIRSIGRLIAYEPNPSES